MDIFKKVGYLFIILFACINNAVAANNFFLDCSASGCRLRKISESAGKERLDLSIYSQDYLKQVEKLHFNHVTSGQLNKHLIDHLPNLKELDAKYGGLKNLDTDWFGAENTTKLPNLRALVLSSNRLTQIGPASFVRAHNLEELSLARNKISEIHRDAFKDLQHLTTLDMSNNHLMQLENRLFKDAHQLLHVDFSYNRLVTVDFDLFGNNKIYHSVKFDNNRIDRLDLSRNDYGVAVLDLSHNSLTDIATLSKLRNLVSLRLSYNPYIELTDTTFMGWSKALQRLLLNGNNLEQQLRHNFDVFAPLQSLEVLSIADNALTELDLAKFPKLQRLTELRINDNNLRSLNYDQLRLNFPQISNLRASGNEFNYSYFQVMIDKLEQIGVSLPKDDPFKLRSHFDSLEIEKLMARLELFGLKVEGDNDIESLLLANKNKNSQRAGFQYSAIEKIIGKLKRLGISVEDGEIDFEKVLEHNQADFALRNGLDTSAIHRTIADLEQLGITVDKENDVDSILTAIKSKNARKAMDFSTIEKIINELSYLGIDARSDNDLEAVLEQNLQNKTAYRANLDTLQKKQLTLVDTMLKRLGKLEISAHEDLDLRSVYNPYSTFVAVDALVTKVESLGANITQHPGIINILAEIQKTQQELATYVSQSRQSAFSQNYAGVLAIIEQLEGLGYNMDAERIKLAEILEKHKMEMRLRTNTDYSDINGLLLNLKERTSHLSGTKTALDFGAIRNIIHKLPQEKNDLQEVLMKNWNTKATLRAENAKLRRDQYTQVGTLVKKLEEFGLNLQHDSQIQSFLDRQTKSSSESTINSVKSIVEKIESSGFDTRSDSDAANLLVEVKKTNIIMEDQLDQYRQTASYQDLAVVESILMKMEEAGYNVEAEKKQLAVLYAQKEKEGGQRSGIDFSAVNKILEKLEKLDIKVNDEMEFEKVLTADQNKNSQRAGLDFSVIDKIIEKLELLGINIKGDTDFEEIKIEDKEKTSRRPFIGRIVQNLEQLESKVEGEDDFDEILQAHRKNTVRSGLDYAVVERLVQKLNQLGIGDTDLEASLDENFKTKTAIRKEQAILQDIQHEQVEKLLSRLEAVGFNVEEGDLLLKQKKLRSSKDSPLFTLLAVEAILDKIESLDYDVSRDKDASLLLLEIKRTSQNLAGQFHNYRKASLSQDFAVVESIIQKLEELGYDLGNEKPQIYQLIEQQRKTLNRLTKGQGLPASGEKIVERLEELRNTFQADVKMSNLFNEIENHRSELFMELQRYPLIYDQASVERLRSVGVSIETNKIAVPAHVGMSPGAEVLVSQLEKLLSGVSNISGMVPLLEEFEQNKLKVRNELNKVHGRLSDEMIERLAKVGVHVAETGPNISDLRRSVSEMDFSAINRKIEKLEKIGDSFNVDSDDLEAVLAANNNNQGEIVRQTINRLQRLGVEVKGDKDELLEFLKSNPEAFKGHQISADGEASLLRLEQLVAQIKQDQTIVNILQEIEHNKQMLANELKRSAAFLDTPMQARLHNIGFYVPTNKHLKADANVLQLSKDVEQLVATIESLGFSISDNPKVTALLAELEENKRKVEKAIEKTPNNLNVATVQRLEKLGIKPNDSNFKRFYLNLSLGRNLENQVKLDIDDLESIEAVKKLNRLQALKSKPERCSMDEVPTEHIIHGLPWVVSVNAIQQDGSTEKICDGTVISSEVVLTSASCVHRNGDLLLEDEIILEMGRPDPTYDSVTDLDGQIVREVKAFIMHPTFKVTDDNKYIPDFAMVVMANPVKFDVNAGPIVFPVCKTRRGQTSESMGDILTGMLVTHKDGSKIPQKQLIPVLPKKACLDSTDQADTFCSGKVNEQSLCSVKEGSGLMMRGENGWELKGVVTKNLIDPATKVCNVDESFVFTKVDADWISQTVEAQKTLPLIVDIVN